MYAFIRICCGYVCLLCINNSGVQITRLVILLLVTTHVKAHITAHNNNNSNNNNNNNNNNIPYIAIGH